MSYLEVFRVLTGVRVDVLKFFGVGHESLSQKQEQSRSQKNVTPLIFAGNLSPCIPYQH